MRRRPLPLPLAAIRILALLMALVLPGTLAAQPPDADTRAKRDQLERDFSRAFNSGDLPISEKLLREWVTLRPMEFVPVYNLACVVSMQGRGDEAAELISQAVNLGFTDRRVLESDPNLRGIRTTDTYRALLAGWPATLDRVIDERIDRARKGFSKKYLFEKDADLRLAFASGQSRKNLDTARHQITRIAAWWQEQVLPVGTKGVIANGESPDPWVMVILPTQNDFNSWAARNFPRREGALSRIGGIYDHDKKELVAIDAGPTFRHEFLHILHWRHMTRLGQRHAIWVQEGLCSLVEDIGPDPDQPVKPVPSWRTNSLKRRAASTKISIEAVARMTQDKFTSGAPLANYALARAVFLYLSDKGKLRDWYKAYCDGLDQDPSGLEALLKVLDKPLPQIEKDFRIWVAKLPEASETDKP